MDREEKETVLVNGSRRQSRRGGAVVKDRVTVAMPAMANNCVSVAPEKFLPLSVKKNKERNTGDGLRCVWV